MLSQLYFSSVSFVWSILFLLYTPYIFILFNMEHLIIKNSKACINVSKIHSIFQLQESSEDIDNTVLASDETNNTATVLNQSLGESLVIREGMYQLLNVD